MDECKCGGNCTPEITSVKVLGSGCAKCHKLLENTKEAMKNKGLSIEPEYVTDIEKAMAYGVMSFPALIINEKIASVGRVLKVSEIEALI
ncbi:MAG: thioredoxin family protein [Solobacterium sp.]|nr:thioredoxin family protein [Solobacterium sp.]